MSEPEDYTAAQASDPETSAQDLADIAALRPDLRAAVAANPSAYPGLVEWLGGLGDPAVDAAIAARQPAESASQEQQGQGQYQQQQGQGQYQQPESQGQYQQPESQGQYQQPESQGQYQQPQGQGQYQQPQGQGQYQQTSSGPTTSLPPHGQYASSGDAAASYGQAPPGAYGYGPGAPPPAKNHTVLWIVVGVVGFLVVLGVVAAVLIGNAVRGAVAEEGTYGSDATLDGYWDRCEDGDWQACDDLYDESPVDSEYEEFGDTCGNRQAGGTGVYCTSAFGDDSTSQDDSTSEGDSTSQSVSSGEPFTYGDDAHLDDLWDTCSGGDAQACDDLYWEAPIGSEYEAFGEAGM